MFICGACGKPSRPREKAITVPTFHANGNIAHEEKRHDACVDRSERLTTPALPLAEHVMTMSKERARIRVGMTAAEWRAKHSRSPRRQGLGKDKANGRADETTS